MGIYIKGMELPECCDKCPLKKYAGSDSMVCRITGYRFYTWDVGWGDKPYVRHESCPLIEVKPHGRLIDADAFTKDECNYCDGACEALPCDCLNCKSDCRCDFMKDIADAPTIIPAEPCNDLAKPNNNIFVVQDTDEDEGLFAAKPIDYMHHPSVEEIIEGNGFDSFIKHFED